ncbi:MAG: hypothetical protein ACLRX7_00925 [Acutalibacteraceae bacterium]
MVTCEEVLVLDEAPDEVPEEDCRLTVCEVLSVSLDVCCSEPQPAKAKERTKTEPTIIIAIFLFHSSNSFVSTFMIQDSTNGCNLLPDSL